MSTRATNALSSRVTPPAVRRKSSRRGATRCAPVCYLALCFAAYIVFVRGTPNTVQSLAQERPQSPTVRLVPAEDDRPAVFEVHGLPADVLRRLSEADAASAAESMFRVSVAQSDEPMAARLERPAMLGEYSVADGVLRFQPRFPLSPGVTYVARLVPPASSGAEPIVERFTIAKPQPSEPTVVTAVYPTSDTLPENQLRFYVAFSAPMSRGQAYRHIRLVRDDGQVVQGALLEIAEELWDRTGTRLTLLLDPGRVKRGLKPREEDGPILEEGRSYKLIIDASWPDAAGNDLKAAYSKSFKVAAPDDDPPDTATWKLQAPAAGTTSPLTVVFPEPLDRALLERVVWVETVEGERVEGQIAVDRHETRWQFTPLKAWDPQGKYVLCAQRILEDRAGNRIGRKFEVDVFEKIDRQVVPEVVRIPVPFPAAQKE